MFAVLIGGCQIAIEVKVYILNREDSKAEKLARGALRQIWTAKHKLEQNGHLVELGVEFLHAPPPAKNAWVDEEERSANPNESPALQSGIMFKYARKQAIRIARYVSIFGIMPALMYIAVISLDIASRFRPHGTIGLMLFIYGILIPFMLIINEGKLKKIAMQFIGKSFVCDK